MHTEIHSPKDSFGETLSTLQRNWLVARSQKPVCRQGWHVAIALLLISLGICFTAVAQRQQKIDSLKSLLPGKTDVERADIFFELAVQYADFDNILFAKCIGQSFQCAKRAGDSLRIVRAGRNKAAAFRRLGELDSAIILGFEMLSIATRNSYGTDVKIILRGIAIGYTLKADYALGLRYNFELLKITEQDNDSLEMSLALSNIGLIFYKFENHKKALQYYHHSLDVKSPLDTYPRTVTFVNMSLCYTVLGDFPRASEFLKKGLDACQPECPGAFMIEWLHANGRVHLYKKRLDSAEVYFLRSYALAKRMDNERYQLVVALELIDIYCQRDQPSLAVQRLSEVEPILKRTSFDFEQMWLYGEFSSFYKKAANDKKRAFYQEKCIQLIDSIYSQRQTNNMMKIESEYLERANKAKITEQEQLLELKDQTIRGQRALNILIGVIALLLIVLLYILYRSNRLRRAANRLLDLKVKERTIALEASHFALKQSLETEDKTLTDTFTDIKSSTVAIKELCSLGLALEERHGVGNGKYLQEIWTVTGRVSVALSNIHGDRMEVKRDRIS